jgi:hypothetical protein
MHCSKKYKRKIMKNKSKSRRKNLVNIRNKIKSKTNNKKRKIRNKTKKQRGGSGNCHSGSSYGTPGLSFSSLVNNPLAWAAEDAVSYFNGTLNGTPIPPSSNPTVQFKG